MAVHREVVELHTEATVVDIVDDMGCTEAAVDIADMDCTSDAAAAVVVVGAEVVHMVEGVVVVATWTVKSCALSPRLTKADTGCFIIILCDFAVQPKI